MRGTQRRGRTPATRLRAGAWGAFGTICALATLGLVAGPTQAQSTPPAAPTTAGAVVTGFVIEGNTLLPQAQIDERLKAFLGRADLKRLRDAAAAVQELYRRAGYGGVVAFLPGQTAEGGQVRIRVVEGKLGKVQVKGNAAFSVDRIRATLPSLKEGQTPEVRLIDAQLQLANENPARNVQVLLQPGADPTTIDAVLTVAERPTLRGTVRADNTGSASSGRWRTAVGVQHANAFGLDHVVSLEAQTAPKDAKNVRIFSGGWRVPLYRLLSNVDVYGAWSDVSNGRTSTAAGDLDFSGRGSVLGLRGTRLLERIGSVDQRVSLGLEGRSYKNQCTIDGLPQAACGSAGASVSLLPLTMSYTAQGAAELAWGANVSLVANAGGGSQGKAANFEAVRAGAKPRYALLRLNANLSTGPLEALRGASVGAQVSAQFTDLALVPGEQFGIGGAQSVRGYEEREINGDTGAQLTLELSSPSLVDAILGQPAALRLAAFLDAGTVSNRKGDNCQLGRNHCNLESLGFGLRLAMATATLKLDWAQALADGPRSASGHQRLHASFNATF
jgi:hemolysin activation/secretion protein